MHPRICERIAVNLQTVRRVVGQKAAAKWWQDRFGHVTKAEYDQVLAELRRRTGNEATPQP